jgi:hypothetical protein
LDAKARRVSHVTQAQAAVEFLDGPFLKAVKFSVREKNKSKLPHAALVKHTDK